MRHLATIAALALLAVPALAGEKQIKLGTPKDALELLNRAIEEVERRGEVAAVDAFENPLRRFTPRDLRPMCYGPDNRIVAPKELAGSNVASFKDSAGGELGKSLGAAVSAGEIQVRHQGRHPGTGELAPQITYVKRAAVLVCWVTAFE